MKYGLNDISIVPAPKSLISSRSQCDPYDKDFMLPLFTAPMSSVVNIENYELFEENKIHAIIPRNVELQTRLTQCEKNWVAFSLDEFIELVDLCKFENGSKVLIDIANGHMVKLHNAIKTAKQIYGDNIKIMAGNIANPETYEILSECGADYVRVGIGGGSMCLTSSNTAVHFPLISLIEECFEISLRLDKPAFIVADGGVRGYSDIIKCLACGADYVMCGSVFNKMLESAGETKIVKGFTANDSVFVKVNQYSDETRMDFENGKYFFSKSNYGMSTKKAQKELGSEKLKTSEGIIRSSLVEYTMSGWVENFTDYLKSAMSYTSSYTLDDFVGNVETIVISNNAYSAINK